MPDTSLGTWFAGAGVMASVTSTTVTPVLYPDWRPGDLAFLHLQQGNNSAVTAPAGWTLIKTQANGGFQATVFYRFLQVGDTNPTVTVASSTSLAAVVSGYVNVNPAASAFQSSAQFSTKTGTAASVAVRSASVPGAGDRLVTFMCAGSNVLSLVTDLSTNSQYSAYGLGGGSGVNTSMVSAWQDMPLNSQRSIVINWASSIAYIAITIVLPPNDRTAQPPVGTLLEAFLQDPLLGTGVQVSPKDTTFKTTLVVQAFNTYPPDVTVWDVNNWDIGDWAGPGKWEDISPRVRGIHCGPLGSTSPITKASVGTATIDLDNRDGYASAWSSDVKGDFAIGNPGLLKTWLQPGTFVRFGMTYLGATAPDSTPDRVWLPFFTGIIEMMPEVTAENVDAWVTLHLAELTFKAGLWSGPVQTAVGAGDTIAGRITRLLNDMLWPSGSVVMSGSADDTATFQDTTKAVNRFQELQLVADTVNMRALCNGAGQFVLTPAFPAVGTVSTDVFSNHPTGSMLPIVSAVPYASTDRIVNYADFTRVGGTPQIALDWPSRDQYGQFNSGGQGAARTDLICQNDTTVLATVGQIVAAHAQDVIGIEQVVLDMDLDPVNLPSKMALYAANGLVARTPFKLNWWHPSGNVFACELCIAGMKYDISPEAPGVQMKWTATFNTQQRWNPAAGSFWADPDPSTGGGFWDSMVWS